MTTSEIAKQILKEMGGDAHEICSGSCPEFAKRLIDAIGRGQIVNNLSREMQGDVSGYENIEPEIYCGNPNINPDQSHCWAKVDGRFYDAFNPDGVDSEDELTWYEENVY